MILFNNLGCLDKDNIKLSRLSSFYLDSFNYNVFVNMFFGFANDCASVHDVTYYLHIFNIEGQLIGTIIPFEFSGDPVGYEDFINLIYEKVCYDCIESVGGDLTYFYTYIGDKPYKCIDNNLI
jgi:hypothetical protein